MFLDLAGGTHDEKTHRPDHGIAIDTAGPWIHRL
jgi:hypothetical protein